MCSILQGFFGLMISYLSYIHLDNVYSHFQSPRGVVFGAHKVCIEVVNMPQLKIEWKSSNKQ